MLERGCCTTFEALGGKYETKTNLVLSPFFVTQHQVGEKCEDNLPKFTFFCQDHLGKKNVCVLFQMC